MSSRADDIAAWIRQRVQAAGARGLAVGLSGGIDSAVVVGLCTRAAPGQVVGVIMPCHSDPRDETDARLAADHFDVPVARIDLAPSYDRLVQDLGAVVAELQPLVRCEPSKAAARLSTANVKPRMRMASLYFVANSLNYLVVGTGNRSELTIGYFTKHGDGGVDILPIGRLLKNEVRELARELGVPEPIVVKPPSAGLWPGQTDEEEMGFTYDDLERYLTEGAERVSPAFALRIERLMRQSEHKRATAPMPE